MRLAIVIPTFNEAANIIELARAIYKQVDCHLIVVDDASPDGTANLLKSQRDSRLTIIERPRKMGLGSAYIDGFRQALARKYEMIGQMDADFSHAPEQIPAMLRALATADLVIGSRYQKGGRIAGWNIWRHFCSRSAIAFARICLRIPASDITSGFRFWRAPLLERVLAQSIGSNGYAFQEEMLFHAYRLGGNVQEKPITFKDRRTGKSKLSSKDVVEFFQTMLRLRKEYGRLAQQAPSFTNRDDA
jgi:dolichol-phosphate mannosyltransferase